MSTGQTVKEALLGGRAVLEHCSSSYSKSYSASAQQDCEILLSHVVGQNLAWLIIHNDALLSEEQHQYFQSCLARCSQGEPVAYIVGRRAFWKHDFDVTQDVLIPRPETELLVELVIVAVADIAQPKIADLGTGSGVIAISLAKELEQAKIVAAEVSDSALELARKNADRIGSTNIEFVLTDWFSALPDRCFDVIVSNPPYVAENDPHLDRGDLRFEPGAALIAGVDGLKEIRQIVRQADDHLTGNGYLFVEHGHEQGDAVRKLFTDAGLANIKTHRDYAHLERVTSGQCA